MTGELGKNTGESKEEEQHHSEGFNCYIAIVYNSDVTPDRGPTTSVLFVSFLW